MKDIIDSIKNPPNLTKLTDKDLRRWFTVINQVTGSFCPSTILYTFLKSTHEDPVDTPCETYRQLERLYNHLVRTLLTNPTSNMLPMDMRTEKDVVLLRFLLENTGLVYRLEEETACINTATSETITTTCVYIDIQKTIQSKTW